MKGGFVDNWGDPRDGKDPRDWSKWPVWRFWDDKYDWREGEDFAAHDIIAWRDEIIVNRNRGRPEKKARWEKTGERMVIAEVREGTAESRDWVYLVVIYSEGDEPLTRDEKIKRRARNILRNGVRRWPRSGRAASEIHAKQPDLGDRRPAPPPLNAGKKLGIESRFFGGGTNPPPEKRPPPRPG